MSKTAGKVQRRADPVLQLSIRGLKGKKAHNREQHRRREMVVLRESSVDEEER